MDEATLHKGCLLRRFPRQADLKGIDPFNGRLIHSFDIMDFEAFIRSRARKSSAAGSFVARVPFTIHLGSEKIEIRQDDTLLFNENRSLTIRFLSQNVGKGFWEAMTAAMTAALDTPSTTIPLRSITRLSDGKTELWL